MQERLWEIKYERLRWLRSMMYNDQADKQWEDLKEFTHRVTKSSRSMVDHHSDTVGVPGSNPGRWTIKMMIKLK